MATAVSDLPPQCLTSLCGAQIEAIVGIEQAMDETFSNIDNNTDEESVDEMIIELEEIFNEEGSNLQERYGKEVY